MSFFIVTTNYFERGYFGVYSTVKRARLALEDFLKNSESIVSIEILDDYCYQFVTKNGEIFNAEIFWDVMDEEFVEGVVKED